MRASVRMRMAAAALAVSGIFASPARAATAAETAAAAADAVVEAALRVAEGDRQAAWLRLVEGRTAADGCLSVDLPAGGWRVYATTESGDCSSDTTPATVTACGLVEVTAYLEDRCVDG